MIPVRSWERRTAGTTSGRLKPRRKRAGTRRVPYPPPKVAAIYSHTRDKRVANKKGQRAKTAT